MIAAPALRFILRDADRVAPGRNHATDGIFPDAAHLAQGVASDHNPDANGICHAVDVTNDPAHGMDTWQWAQVIAQRIIAGQEHRVKYLVSNDGTGPDVIFNPSVSLAWRQNGSYKTEHRSHLHTSILSGSGPENDTTPYFVGESFSPTGALMALSDDEQKTLLAQVNDLHNFMGEVRNPAPYNPGQRWVGIIPRLQDVVLFANELKSDGKLPWSGLLARAASFLSKSGA